MRVIVAIVFSLSLFLASAPVSAHHAFAVEFDAKNCADVTGVLTRVDYQNPHAYLYLAVKDASGDTVEAAFQLSSTSNLHRGGATVPVFNASLNKEVMIRGCAARSGEPHRYAASYVRLSDGTVQRVGQDVEGVFGNRIWR